MSRVGLQTPRVRVPSLGFVVGAAVALTGLVIGLRPLSDNSFFTHLATGRLIAHGHGIPRVDVFSFSAPGHAWVVQSWLPAALYGFVERLAGGFGLVALHGAQTALIAALAWRLTAAARTLVSRLLAVIPAIVIGNVLWSPRPLLIGLISLALVALIVEDDRISPWWLLPIGWVWVNSHGSFPFGVLYLLCRLGGRVLERRPVGRLPRLVGFSVAGVALGALNPLGARLLTFPLHLLGNHKVLSHIIEWKHPDFSRPANLVFLVAAATAIVLAARARRWEDGLVAVVFGLAGMLALRNTVVASLALTPVLARGVAGLGAVTADRRSALTRAGLLAVFAVGAVLVLGAHGRSAYDLSSYPVSELRWMQTEGLLRQRVATVDAVGNLRTLSEGPGPRVFMDDRYDMYPAAVALDYVRLYEGGSDSLQILDRYAIDVVLWQRQRPLARMVSADARWRVARESGSWLVAVRNGVPTRSGPKK